MKEALKQILDLLQPIAALADNAPFENSEVIQRCVDASEIALDALAHPEQEPVAHSVIAGVLFDFMGWLTSRKERIVLSSADNASPAVEAITEFAKMRNLSLDDAKVQDWNTTPPQRTLVGLTDEEIREIHNASAGKNIGFATGLTEAKLKEKNTRQDGDCKHCVNGCPACDARRQSNVLP